MSQPSVEPCCYHTIVRIAARPWPLRDKSPASQGIYGHNLIYSGRTSRILLSQPRLPSPDDFAQSWWMHNQNVVPDKFTLSGDHLDRLRQALKVAGHQARVAQHGGYGRNIEDALAEIEESISTQLTRIESALDDDKAEAEDTAEALRTRRSWFPRYRAA